jgi:hypothetical protein
MKQIRGIMILFDNGDYKVMKLRSNEVNDALISHPRRLKKFHGASNLWQEIVRIIRGGKG